MGWVGEKQKASSFIIFPVHNHTAVFVNPQIHPNCPFIIHFLIIFSLSQYLPPQKILLRVPHTQFVNDIKPPTLSPRLKLACMFKFQTNLPIDHGLWDINLPAPFVIKHLVSIWLEWFWGGEGKISFWVVWFEGKSGREFGGSPDVFSFWPTKIKFPMGRKWERWGG